MIRGIDIGPDSGRGDRIAVLVYEHVTGGGMAGAEIPASWAAEGSAIRRAVAGDFASLPGVRVVMPLDSRLPDEPGPWEVVRAGPSRDVFRIAAGVDLTAPIAPETGGVLHRLAAGVVAAGGVSIGSDPSAIAAAADKLRLCRTLRRLGIPTPGGRPVRPREGLPAGPCGYPAVLKPVDGAGCLSTFLVEAPDDPIVAAYPDETGLLTRYIPGEPRGATFLARGDGRARLLGVARQEIAIEAGRFTYQGGTLLDLPLAADHPARRAVAALAGLRGPVGVDYVEDRATGAATVIEINPRPTTSLVGIVAALGPGRVASAWLGRDQPDEMSLLPLARPLAPVRFWPDGRVER